MNILMREMECATIGSHSAYIVVGTPSVLMFSKPLFTEWGTDVSGKYAWYKDTIRKCKCIDVKVMYIFACNNLRRILGEKLQTHDYLMSNLKIQEILMQFGELISNIIIKSVEHS